MAQKALSCTDLNVKFRQLSDNNALASILGKGYSAPSRPYSQPPLLWNF